VESCFPRVVLAAPDQTEAGALQSVAGRLRPQLVRQCCRMLGAALNASLVSATPGETVGGAFQSVADRLRPQLARCGSFCKSTAKTFLFGRERVTMLREPVAAMAKRR
jgi:hypothetical protein